MAESWLHRREDLSLNPQHLCQHRCVVHIRVCDSRSGKVEAGGSLELIGQLAWPVSELQAWRETPAHKPKWTVIEEDTQG